MGFSARLVVARAKKTIAFVRGHGPTGRSAATAAGAALLLATPTAAGSDGPVSHAIVVVVVSVVQQGTGFAGTRFPVPGPTGHGKGEKGGDKQEETKGQKGIGHDAGPGRFDENIGLVAGATAPRVAIGGHGGPKDLIAVHDLVDASLGMSHGNALSFANERIVGMELPALVDEIVIVGSVIANKVSILVGRIIHAGRTIRVFFVDIVQILERVFLGIVPPIVQIISVAVSFVLAAEIDVGLGDIVVVRSQRCVGLEAVLVRVQRHLKAAIGLRGHAGLDGIAAGIFAQLETIGVRHVHEAGPGHNILVIVNGPQVLGDLFNELVEFLAVDAHELPFGIGIVAVQRAIGFLGKILVVFVGLVVGIDVLFVLCDFVMYSIGWL